MYNFSFRGLTIESLGLNNLVGFEFTSVAIVFPPDADGTNLVGNVTLPNPTVISLELVRILNPPHMNVKRS